MLHLSLHIIVPLVLAFIFFKAKLKIVFFVMIATMLVDLDHLLAEPVYDPNRCSIGFHPLHEFIPILIYCGLCLVKKLRYMGIGLVIHMVLDSFDCMITNGVWYV
ncbi:MAG: DUF6122 family protein [Proteobacteria bacterium]|nr:DUF6122 family protein [Pseudomonadota bacterium]